MKALRHHWRYIPHALFTVALGWLGYEVLFDPGRIVDGRIVWDRVDIDGDPKPPRLSAAGKRKLRDDFKP